MRSVCLVGACLSLLFASANCLYAAGLGTKICSSLANEAKYIMERRQEGISKRTTQKIVAEVFEENDHDFHNMVKGIIDYAYDEPVQNTKNSKEQYSLIFGVVFYEICMGTGKEK